jgi:Tol biopolymer transport system component
VRWFDNTSHLRFCKIHYTGCTLDILTPHHEGSGHPTLSPDNQYILSDAYTNERVAYADGSVPIRFINLSTHVSSEIIRIQASPTYMGPKKEWRIDPHPAWSPSGRYLVFNGCHKGMRSVYIADMRKFLYTKGNS